MFFATTGNCDIAFVASIGGNWDLFTVNDDGSNLVRLTETQYDEKTPSWSFDGKKIVYATSDGNLNLIDVQTKETHQIAVSEKKYPKITPSFSPDNKEIAFARFRAPEEGDDTDLLIYNLETKQTERVLDQYAIQMWPAWSPDGSRLVYANIHCSSACGRIIQELWIVDPRGNFSRQLLMTNSLCQEPAWSSDGKQVVFSSDKSGNYDIWVLSLDDRKLKQITTYSGLDISPSWSTDGKKLAFVSTRSGIMEIWIKDMGSGKLRRLRPFGEKGVECKDVAWNRK